MGGNAHLFTRFGEKVIVLGASFFGARFGASGAVGEKIGGDGAEQFMEEGRKQNRSHKIGVTK